MSCLTNNERDVGLLDHAVATRVENHVRNELRSCSMPALLRPTPVASTAARPGARPG